MIERTSVSAALVRVLVAIPPVVATAWVLWFGLNELRGETPYSLGDPRNVAEAAGLANGSELLRLLRAGQDPRRVWDVRPEVISSTVTHVTAIEAAVWSRKAQVIELLDREGALADPGDRQRALCLARDLPVDEVVAYLTPTTTAECAPNATVEAVLARTRGPGQ